MANDFSQCYISSGLEFFKQQVLTSWSCIEYHDKQSPAIFIGIYTKEDIELFSEHKGAKILFLGGSDYDNVKLLNKQTNAYCPVFSHSLEYQLTKAGIKCKPWPVSIRDFTHIPRGTTLGNKIYVYSGNDQRDYLKDKSGLNKGLYQQCIAPLIEELGEENFLFAKQLSMEALIEQVYKQCFIFIKPNELGGNSAMWELAHMGRKTITCGMFEAPNIVDFKLAYQRSLKDRLLGRHRLSEYPTKNAIGYEDIDAVIRTIRSEQANIGAVNSELTSKVEALFYDLPWQNIEFWQ